MCKADTFNHLFSIRSIVAKLALLLLLGSPVFAGWTSYRVVTIDHTKVSTADQTNFPVFYTTRCDSLGAAISSTGATSATLTTGTCTQTNDYIQIDSEIMQITAGGGTTSITITRAQKGTSAATHSNAALVTNMFLSSSTYGGTVTSTSGYDIGFFSDNACTVPIPFERTQWTASTGLATFHILFSTLSHTTDPTMNVCYNNSSIVGDLQSPRDVWINYAGVYHFTTAVQGLGGDLYDSSSSYNNLSASSTIPFTSAGVTSPMGSGWQLNGSGGWQRLNSFGHANIKTGTGAPLTLEGWFNLQSLTTACNSGCVPFGWGGTAGLSRVSLDWANDSKLYLDTNGGGGQDDTCAFTNDSAWHHWAAVMPNGTTTVQSFVLYIDGTACSQTNGSGTMNIATTQVTVGWSPGLNQGYPGLLDEVRFSNTDRSASWEATQYNNQKNAATFFKSVGTATAPVLTGGMPASRIFTQQ